MRYRVAGEDAGRVIPAEPASWTMSKGYCWLLAILFSIAAWLGLFATLESFI
jgi:hypothetical protein